MPRMQPKPKASDLHSLIKRQEPAIQQALPPGLPLQQFVRAALTTINLSPKVRDADPMTTIASIMEAASLGLYIGSGPLAEVDLVPYKGRTTMQVGYRGYLTLLYRSGLVSNVRAGVIHENDEWEYQTGIEEVFSVTPTMDPDPGQIVAAWCVITYNDGTSTVTVMPRRDVERRRQASKNATGSTWSLWYDQMAIKTVVKHACKLAPRRIELSEVFDAVAQDDAIEQTVIDVDATIDLTPEEPEKKPRKRTSRKKAASKAKEGDKKAPDASQEDNGGDSTGLTEEEKAEALRLEKEEYEKQQKLLDS